jgi:hypothetical protein
MGTRIAETIKSIMKGCAIMVSKKEGYKLPLVFSVIFAICAIGYGVSFVWEFPGISYLVFGIIFTAIFTVALFKPLPVLEKIFAGAFVVCALLLAFESNLHATFFSYYSRERMFFEFSDYRGVDGVLLGLHQISAVVSIILIVRMFFTDATLGKNAKYIFLATGLLGFFSYIANGIGGYINISLELGIRASFYDYWIAGCILSFYLICFVWKREKIK